MMTIITPILIVLCYLYPWTILDIEKNTPTLIKARHGAVATEEIHCSEIGVQGKQLVRLTARNFWGLCVIDQPSVPVVHSFVRGVTLGGWEKTRIEIG